MILLPCTHLPAGREPLERALRDGLRPLLAGPPGRPAIVLAGNSWPTLERLEIDVSGMTVLNEALGMPPAPPARAEAEFTTVFFDLRAEPFFHEGARLEFRVAGRDVRFGIGPAAAGRRLLYPVDAEQGALTARAGKESLETLLLEAVHHFTGEMGATIEDVRLELEPAGPRAVHVDASVTVTKVVSAELQVAARLEIDDQLRAVVSDVEVRAAGIAGRLFGGLLDRAAKRIEGRTIALTAFHLGQLRLADVAVRVTGGIEVSATFGGA